MKINVEIMLFVFVMYFLLGDPLSLGNFLRGELGKGILFLIVLFFTSYNIIYGLLSLMVIIVLEDYSKFKLDNMFGTDTVNEKTLFSIKESLKNKCDGGVCLNNFQEYNCDKNCSDGNHCCNMEFKYLDNRDIISKESKIIPRPSNAVINNSSSENVLGAS